MKTVLIVEDAVLNTDLISQLLGDDGELLFARYGREGVAQARDSRPDPIPMTGIGLAA